MLDKVKVLYSEEDIEKRLKELASQINKDYAGEELTVVGVLKGSFIFMADLVRHLKIPVRCDFLRVSSYENDVSTGVVRMVFDLTQPIAGQHVLLIEDIVDTGRTLDYLIEHMEHHKAKSVKVCSLLLKEDICKKPEKVDYVGFKTPNKFVIGYGLDSQGLYRSLPYVGFVE